MRLDWLASSNPVSGLVELLFSSAPAIPPLLVRLHFHFRQTDLRRHAGTFATEPLLTALRRLVCGCAYRSRPPTRQRAADSLFDTWLLQRLFGRSIATVAELCFVIRSAHRLRALATSRTRIRHAIFQRRLASGTLPLAEAAWYAVVTTNSSRRCAGEFAVDSGVSAHCRRFLDL